ncbi:unnamed protein product [marine sediment metagenome]|uniref:Uncharacterized protein n=1 Tax=marine sediment metagenome TaxID=412755 RepID=X1SJN2_9ZZZZ
MRLYESTIIQFREDVIQNKIADIISNKYLSYYGKNVGSSEKNSWKIGK